MRYVTFQRYSFPEPGVLVDDNTIVSLHPAGFEDMLAVLRGGADARMRVENWLSSPPGGHVVKASEVRMRAPILRPGKIICVGLNYRDHAIESKLPIPEVPTIFAKYPNTVIGPTEPIVLPRVSAKPDYEAEMAFVIGRRCRHVPAPEWRDFVFGYMNLNDVSARDYQMATSQWTIGKTFDTFAPMGPALVTADEISDPHKLDIRMLVNGEVRQNSNTSNLIFPIPELLAYLTSVCTLEIGDVISTGTPSGVGFSFDPPRWLKAGDEVVVEVQGLGQLRNPVVAEPAE